MEKGTFYIRPYSFYVILSLLFAVLTGVLTLYAPILVGDAIDFIIGKDQVLFDRILDILKKLAVIIAITGVGQWLMNLCNNQITYRVVRDVRLKAFKNWKDCPFLMWTAMQMEIPSAGLSQTWSSFRTDF